MDSGPDLEISGERERDWMRNWKWMWRRANAWEKERLTNANCAERVIEKKRGKIVLGQFVDERGDWCCSRETWYNCPYRYHPMKEHAGVQIRMDGTHTQNTKVMPIRWTGKGRIQQEITSMACKSTKSTGTNGDKWEHGDKGEKMMREEWTCQKTCYRLYSLSSISLTS